MPPGPTLVGADLRKLSHDINKLKLSISETNKHAVDYSASGMDVGAKESKSHWRHFKQMFTLAVQKITAISTDTKWVPRIGVTKFNM